LKKQKEEERKRREEERKREKEEAAKKGYTQLKVYAGHKEVFDAVEAARLAYKALRDRIKSPSSSDDSFEFSPRATKVVESIHKHFTGDQAQFLSLPEHEILEGSEFTIDQLKGAPLEEFIQKAQIVADMDPKLFF